MRKHCGDSGNTMYNPLKTLRRQKRKHTPVHISETAGPPACGGRPREGLKARVVGGRKITRRPDETVLARQREWMLLRVEGWCHGEWASLKLIRDRRGPKNVWQLGTNGERMARNRDLALLVEHHPQIADWVRSIVTRA